MRNPILDLIREDDISYDPFGTALAWQFAIADVLSEWGPPYVPASWEHHNPFGPGTGTYAYQDLAAMMQADEITGRDLIRAGNVCKRIVSICHRNGKSY